MKTIIFLASILCFTSAFAQNSTSDSVKACMEGYKSAILKGKGEEALHFLDSRTVDYYSSILEKVKTADSSEIETYGLLDKMNVLIIRCRMDSSTIASLDGRSLIVKAIQMGMIGKNSVANNSLGEIIVDSNFALAQMVVRGKPQPMYMHFYREERQWKIDLTSMFPVGEGALREYISSQKQTDNEFMINMLTMLTGKQPDSSIWHPKFRLNK